MNKVEICGVNTSGLPTLSREEKNELFVKIKNGDTDAREQFVNGNLRLVLSVIQRFGNRNENVDDLFQVGCIGLIKAIDNFDLSQNVQFSTYAVPMIIGEIRRYLRDNNPIRVSRSLRDIAYKALRARDELAARNNNDPAIADIARELSLPEEDVMLALEAIQDPISFSDPVYQDGGDAICVADQIRDQSVSEDQWVRTLSIKNAIDHLADRQKSIIRSRFFQGKTQMEVADEIGISQAQVSRLEKTALKQMQKYIG